MKARVVQRPELDSFDVYLYADTPEGRIGLTATDARWMHVAVPDGGELPVTIRLQHDAYEALARAIIPPPDDAGASALRDAQATRDRLLTLVETITTGSVGWSRRDPRA